jgi:hypothetical protein
VAVVQVVGQFVAGNHHAAGCGGVGALQEPGVVVVSLELVSVS